MDKILIIDDDIDLCNLMQQGVLHEGFTPLIAYNKRSALSILSNSSKDICLIILDIMLPDGNGLELLSLIRNNLQCPIIMVTVKDSLEDKVIGLRLGADDYLTKPFSIIELEARIAAQTRRFLSLAANSENSKDILNFSTIVINVTMRSVCCNNRELSFTGREFDILYLLASNPGTVFTKKQIYEHIWNEEYLYDDNSLMALICKIRKKIETCEPNINYIETIRGIGYRFNKGA